MRRLLLLAILAACTTKFQRRSTSYEYTATRAAPAKPDACEFDVLTTRPDRAFDEIGVLDHERYGTPSNIADFKAVIADQVCRAGGDAVIAFANGDGLYIKGTVLRYTEAAERDPAAQPADAEALAPTPAAAPATIPASEP